MLPWLYLSSRCGSLRCQEVRQSKGAYRTLPRGQGLFVGKSIISFVILRVQRIIIRSTYLHQAKSRRCLQLPQSQRTSSFCGMLVHLLPLLWMRMGRLPYTCRSRSRIRRYYDAEKMDVSLCQSLVPRVSLPQAYHQEVRLWPLVVLLKLKNTGTRQVLRERNAKVRVVKNASVLCFGSVWHTRLSAQVGLAQTSSLCKN